VCSPAISDHLPMRFSGPIGANPERSGAPVRTAHRSVKEAIGAALMHLVPAQELSVALAGEWTTNVESQGDG